MRQHFTSNCINTFVCAHFDSLLNLRLLFFSFFQTPELDSEVFKSRLRTWRWAASSEELHSWAELSPEQPGAPSRGLVDSCVPDAMQRERGRESWMKLWIITFLFLFYFVIGRRTSPLSKSTKNPLCEHSEDNAAGEEDARWSRRRNVWLYFDSLFLWDFFFFLHLGYINWHRRLIHSQHMHHPLPSPGVLTLAESISMGTANPQEGSAQKKASH